MGLLQEHGVSIENIEVEMSFWRHREPEFEEDKFREFLDIIILSRMESTMADIAKLQADIDAQAALITAVNTKIEAQAAHIAALEAQIAAAPAADPQPPIDALAATVEANNAALTTAGA